MDIDRNIAIKTKFDIGDKVYVITHVNTFYPIIILGIFFEYSIGYQNIGYSNQNFHPEGQINRLRYLVLTPSGQATMYESDFDRYFTTKNYEEARKHHEELLYKAIENTDKN